MLTLHRRAAAALLAALAVSLYAAAQPPPYTYNPYGPPPSRFQQPPQQTQGSAQAAVPAGAYTGPAMYPSPAPSSGGYGYNPWGGGYGAGNRYEGYLNGAANVTTANAEYQMITQQARLVREQANQSHLDTRRKTMEERQYELAMQPDPEEVRQKDMYRALHRARNNPPAVEIWAGDALNSILTALQSAQARGIRGPRVPLAPDLVKHINVTTGVTRGSTGLLKAGGKLSWPFVLRSPDFDGDRSAIDKLLREAISQAPSGEINFTTLTALDTGLKQLQADIDAKIVDLTPDQYVGATRYVKELKGGFNVLKQPDVSKYFSPQVAAQGSTVAELVAHMTANGLKFAPAVSGDESYYTALYQDLAAYDNGVAMLVARPGPPQGGPTGRP